MNIDKPIRERPGIITIKSNDSDVEPKDIAELDSQVK